MKPESAYENVVRIGQYQLQNLQAQRIGFIFLDLRAPELVATQAPGHSLLSRSQNVDAGAAAEFVRGMILPNHAPIVLICENGAKSLGVALKLEDSGFINVFVVEGGTSALNFDPAN